MNAVQVQTLAHILAANARVEGMRAANQHRLSLGHSIAYDEEHFFAEAAHLETLAEQAINNG